MPPVTPTPGQFPKTICGIHDVDGASFLAQNNCSGWLVHSVNVNADSPTDYTTFVNQGLRVIVRLNNGYGSDGTIPVPAGYDAFAQECANWVAASKGAQVWIIGNETNSTWEAPQGQAIIPSLYVQCFLKCRSAIHGRSGHANDLVGTAAVAPWNPSQGDWVTYFQNVLQGVSDNCDCLALHTYGRGNTPASVTDESKFDPPYQNDHKSFRTYRDFMGVIPSSLRGLPVFITETQPMINDQPNWANQNTGWVQAAFAEINAWNQIGANQPIQALCLFRWTPGNAQWQFGDKSAVLDDFRAAIQMNYAVVLPRGTTQPDQGLQQAALGKARSLPWMPVNNQAALWQYAKAHGLQDQQTDELPFTYNGEQYIVQVFNLGIVYAKVGDWGNVHVIPK